MVDLWCKVSIETSSFSKLISSTPFLCFGFIKDLSDMLLKGQLAGTFSTVFSIFSDEGKDKFWVFISSVCSEYILFNKTSFVILSALRAFQK